MPLAARAATCLSLPVRASAQRTVPPQRVTQGVEGYLVNPDRRTADAKRLGHIPLDHVCLAAEPHGAGISPVAVLKHRTG
jgi:hypothetical protein